MKKLMMIAVVTLASASAFATKARYNTLNNSPHLIDTQTIFLNPADLTTMGSWASFETGGTKTAATGATTPDTVPDAEAGFSRSAGDARWGAYFGHKNIATTLRQTAAPATYLLEENPINLFYAAKMADISWGVGLNYSNSSKTAATGGKQTTGGIVAGARMGAWDGSIIVGAIDTAEVGANKWTGKPSAEARGGFAMDNWYLYGDYMMSAGSSTTNSATTKDLDNYTAKLGVVNTTKVDGGEFFWGAAAVMDKAEEKLVGTKQESTYIPVVLGIEADAATWLVFRGSVTQDVLLSSVKNSPGDTVSRTNNTTVAVGTGIKFNKFMLDSSLAGSTNGQINGANLLANAGLTYMF
jgi:hypothetical protein